MPEVRFVPAVKLPARAIRDQGLEVNCCTSCALTACLEALRRDFPELSPLFHFRMSGSHAGTSGLTEAAALGTGRVHGFCLQSLYPAPLSNRGLTLAVSRQAIADGRTRRLADRQNNRLWRVAGAPDRVLSWKSALNRGHPIFLGIATDAPYDSLRTSGITSWVPSTAPPGSPGNHAVAILGYDDASAHFIIQDSRGRSFALGGQWFLSYRDATRSNRITASYEIG
jgi:hypothetical protein